MVGSREGKSIGWIHENAVVRDSAYRQEPSPEPASTLPAPDTALLTPIQLPPGDYGRFYALIIGNNNYKSLPKLKTAANDARAVAKLLKDEYGYTTQLLLNATRAETLRALGRYRRNLTKTDNLLVYYAGHGWLDQAANSGYWLPVDATKDDEVNWISNGSITAAVKAIPAKHILIVADSCYSGKLARGMSIKRRGSNYLARIASKRARSVLSSGGLEPVVDSGGKGNHSVFASAILTALKENKGALDGTQLFSLIRRPVMLNSDQTPEYSDIRKAGHDGGDFLFIRKKK